MSTYSYRSFNANLKDKLRLRNKPKENLIVTTVLPPPEFSKTLTWTVDQLRHLFQLFLNHAVDANPEMFHPQDIQELTKRFSEMNSIQTFTVATSRMRQPWTWDRVPGFKKWKTDEEWVSAIQTMIELIPQGCPIPDPFERKYKGLIHAFRDLIAVPNGLPPMLIPKAKMQTLISAKRKAEEELEQSFDSRPDKTARLDQWTDKAIKQEDQQETSYEEIGQHESAPSGPSLQAESGGLEDTTAPAEPATSTQTVPQWAAQTLIKTRMILRKDINPETESADCALLRRNMTDALDCVIMEVAKLFNRQYVASSTTTSATGNIVEGGDGRFTSEQFHGTKSLASSPSILEDRPAQMTTCNRVATYDDGLPAAQINPKFTNLVRNPAHGNIKSPQKLTSAGGSSNNDNRGRSVPAPIGSKHPGANTRTTIQGASSAPPKTKNDKPEQYRKSSTPSVPNTPKRQ